jgi:hypothetical protein
MSSSVVILDLRDHGPDGALNEVRGRLADQQVSDLTRLVVLDDAWTLADNRRAYEALLSSGRMNRLLCVAVGRLRQDREVLQVPGSIAGGEGGSSVLWVIDSSGVDWKLASSSPAMTRDPGAGSGLRQLTDVLATPDVYDRVCDLAAEIPDAVANPGLYLAGLAGGQPEFLTALSGVTSRIVDGHVARAAPSADVFKDLVADLDGKVSIRPDGRVGMLRDGCERAIGWAAELSERLPEISTLFGARVEMRAAVADAGNCLYDLRTTLTRLFREVNNPGELSSQDYDLLHLSGVEPSAAAPLDENRVSAAISGYVEAALDAKNPLPRISETLGALERGMAPRGSREHLASLERACPDGLIETLRNPVPFPAPEPWLPVAGATATFLASLSGYPGLLMALLWTGVMVLTTTKAPVGRLRIGGGALTANLLAAIVGGAAGLLTGAHADLSGAFVLVAAGLGLGIAGVAVGVSWRSRATRWCGRSGLNEASAALEGMMSALRQTAIQEWSRGPARAGIVDAITCARTAVDGVGTALSEFDARLRPELRKLPAGTSEGNLGPTVQGQLADLVLAALEPRWRELTTGDSASPHERLARARTTELLGQWEKHVEENGPLDPPDFARFRPMRTARVSADDMAEITRAARHDPHDVMWQLCSPRDIAQLDAGGGRPRAVRFAPRSAQQAIGKDLPSDVEWIDSVRHAGILRLVPVRPGAVRRAWFAEEDGSHDEQA